MHISHSDVVQSVVSYFSESKFADFFVDVEREIQMGSTVRRADIVLRDARGRFMAIAECKRPSEDVSGRLQLKSYLNATSTRFGLLATSTDGNQWAFCENKGGNQFRQISRTAFESGVLGESARAFTSGSVEADKPQSVRIWRYAAGILGMGLLISIILLLMYSNPPEQPAMQVNAPEQATEQANTPEQPAVQSFMQEQSVTHLNTPKQPTVQTNTLEKAMQSATPEQQVTHLNALKQPTVQTNTLEKLAMQSTTLEQQVTHLNTLKQPTVQTNTLEKLAMQSATPEQRVTHLNIPKQLVGQANTLEKLVVHTIGKGVLIPAGDFQMGGGDSDAETDEQPVHTVYVDAFYIDKYVVTNAQYKKFVDANPQWQKDNIPRYLHNGKYLRYWRENAYYPSKENHPVVHVSWYAAMAYAKWADKRLPTEAEWEKAARGGVVGRKYPWGDLIDSTKTNYGREVGKTVPVGTYPANDYGLYDMVGNVMEWCLDAYEIDYYSRSSSRNPIAGDALTDLVDNFLNVTSPRVVRSGSWYNAPMHVRIADRYGTSPDDASSGRGFRCAASAKDLPK